MLLQCAYAFVAFNRAGYELLKGKMVYDVKLPYETMVVRRLYALELWMVLIALFIYLALTEFKTLF